ncbi:hypothetical protein D3C71_1853540 [compost metagenome]
MPGVQQILVGNQTSMPEAQPFHGIVAGVVIKPVQLGQGGTALCHEAGDGHMKIIGVHLLKLPQEPVQLIFQVCVR